MHCVDYVIHKIGMRKKGEQTEKRNMEWQKQMVSQNITLAKTNVMMVRNGAQMSKYMDLSPNENCLASKNPTSYCLITKLWIHSTFLIADRVVS